MVVLIEGLDYTFSHHILILYYIEYTNALIPYIDIRILNLICGSLDIMMLYPNLSKLPVQPIKKKINQKKKKLPAQPSVATR